MRRKPISIILQGDISEAQKYVGFARSKASVANNYKNFSGASSFKKQYRIDNAEITVQALNDAITIYIDVEEKADIYIQDDSNYFQNGTIYYTTNIWKVRSFPKSPGENVRVQKVITVDKEPGLWNDEPTNAEVWFDPWPGQKIDIKYPHYFYVPIGDSKFTPASTWYRGEIVSNIVDFRFYSVDGNLEDWPTSHTYGFKYQPVSGKGYSRYFYGDNHIYPIAFSDLSRYDVENPVEPQATIPFSIGTNGFQQWWSGIPNFHVVGIHKSGDMYYTASRYDGNSPTRSFRLFKSTDFSASVTRR